jgi:ADP-ribosylglycohydrolase
MYEGFMVRDFLHKISGLIEPYSPQFAGCVLELRSWLRLDEQEARYRIAAAGWMRPEDRLDYISPFVVPTVLMALYSFMKSPDDYCKSVERAIRAGGDVDTTGSITGAISGAFNGIEGIPSHLVDALKDTEYIQGAATRLYRAKCQNQNTR